MPFGLALMLILMLPQVPGHAADGAPEGEAGVGLAEAGRLLERMNTALRSLDYQGTLVYLSDNRLETLHLVHRVDQGRVQERLVSLSGPVRAVTRERDRVTCVMPDGHPISVQGHRQGHLLQSRAIDPSALTARYRIEVLGTARVAGREAEVLAISPLDDYRYGYRFHLDRATGLPLKSDLIDPQGEAIQQLLFTSIDLTSAPVGAVEGPPSSDQRETRPETPPGPSRWHFEHLPPGFELALHDVMQDAQGAAVDHFVFSDRLSSYSIYVEQNGANGLTGVTRIGAVHAAGRLVDGHQVTAVGEVPAATVEAAVQGVTQVPEVSP